ncbi:hypothetical protein LSCM1_07875 [Leishmania martiniquensis]|uniref:MINDY4 N-terminal dimerisation domain-containing protein n=1 Tax=Leishmania martiniquensis TaxID=1580590 RepID=A0A836HNA3_9TRYP|nr:hypothetical protein LSCM1_07875 [Leishmania martiniquensis]
MTQLPSASEKDKTARLVESLSRHEQVELLAQALLREYMHRRGLRETLRAFDAENPRDERTISSRALMRRLLNIPVEGRPSRLQPTASSPSVKTQAPTFMEELCSHRLVKRGYKVSDGRRGGEHPYLSEEDPSDVERRGLRAAADAQRAAKALCEQKRREYDELLAAEAAHQRRREERRDKRKQRRKAKRKRKGDRRSHGDADSSDDGAPSESGSSDDSRVGEETALSVGASKALRKAQSASLSRRWAAAEPAGGASAVAVAVGAHWQPPGMAAQAAANHNGADDGALRGCTKPVSGGVLHQGPDSDGNRDHSGHEEVDPFGVNCASRQAMMARVRAGSEHWLMQAHRSAAHPHASSTANGSGGGGALDSSPSSASAALLTPVGREACGGGRGSPSSTRPVARAEAGLNHNSTHTSASFFGSLSSTVPAGASGGVAALRMKASPIPISGLSGDNGVAGLASSYSSGFAPAALAVKPPSSILVKHMDTPPQGDRSAVNDGPLHSYDRTAVPRSSALAGSSGGINARSAVRSPSPNASPLSRSLANGVGGAVAPSGGGGNGLRHGIGFRTSSASAESMTSPSTSMASAVELAAGAAKSSRKERRVKLLVD